MKPLLLLVSLFTTVGAHADIVCKSGDIGNRSTITIDRVGGHFDPLKKLIVTIENLDQSETYNLNVVKDESEANNITLFTDIAAPNPHTIMQSIDLDLGTRRQCGADIATGKGHLEINLGGFLAGAPIEYDLQDCNGFL